MIIHGLLLRTVVAYINEMRVICICRNLHEKEIFSTVFPLLYSHSRMREEAMLKVMINFVSIRSWPCVNETEQHRYRCMNPYATPFGLR